MKASNWLLVAVKNVLGDKANSGSLNVVEIGIASLCSQLHVFGLSRPCPLPPWVSGAVKGGLQPDISF
jgi:hypothetical protein